MKRIYQGVDIDKHYHVIISECETTPSCAVCGYAKVCEDAKCSIKSISKEDFIKRLEKYIEIV